MITVHIICGSHIDPIWLWPWYSGLDAALATFRSACDRLDTHSDLHFSQGEAWVYDQVERIAPRLFDRVRRHEAAGRWHVVGGWWIQPDCNGPSEFGFARQIECGREYFLDRFGRFPRTAFNIDSFGHAACLPDLMHAAGQDRYVMMRPQENELTLPARIFRWRGRPDGREVVTFRIAGGYAVRDLTLEHIQAALTELPPGVEHTMCFIGLGDHGGGPTEAQIAWIRAHRDRVPGCRLEFSAPERFFDAIWPQRAALPVHTGELQIHAVGCYSTHRAIKTAVRQAEHALRQAELMQAVDPAPDGASARRIRGAWREVAFAHFHDTYGGTCLPTSYAVPLGQVCGARAAADEVLQHGLRRLLETMPDDPLQRIVVHNASDAAYDWFVEHTPFFEHVPFGAGCRLLDAHGERVPFQVIPAEAAIEWANSWCVRLLWPLRAGPNETRVFRLASAGAEPPRGAPAVTALPEQLANTTGLLVRLDEQRFVEFPDRTRLGLPRWELLQDASDTWAHDVHAFAGGSHAEVRWKPGRVIERGPLRAAARQEGRLGESVAVVEYRVYAGSAWMELLVELDWRERHKILKLAFDLPGRGRRRWDGVPGCEIERPLDGREWPLRDRTLVEVKGGSRLGVVSPDTFAVDVTPERVRLTLVRSPLFAHHDPTSPDVARPAFTDQGPHAFRLRVFWGGPGAPLTGELLDQHALMMHRPLVMADLTRGMPPG